MVIVLFGLLYEMGYVFWFVDLNNGFYGCEVYFEIEVGCIDYYFQFFFVNGVFYLDLYFFVDGVVVYGYCFCKFGVFFQQVQVLYFVGGVYVGKNECVLVFVYDFCYFIQ